MYKENGKNIPQIYYTISIHEILQLIECLEEVGFSFSWKVIVWWHIEWIFSSIFLVHFPLISEYSRQLWVSGIFSLAKSWRLSDTALAEAKTDRLIIYRCQRRWNFSKHCHHLPLGMYVQICSDRGKYIVLGAINQISCSTPYSK